MEPREIKRIIESLLYVADQPVSIETLKSVLEDIAAEHDLEAFVKEIAGEYEARQSPMELKFIAGGWQFATRREFSSWIRKLYREKTVIKLSTSALETLSVIAYKQPVTRSEIEEIRGVEVSGVIETLLERKLIKIVGRKETIGRPLLYGTTQEFLRHFGLTHLSELPSISEAAASEAAPAPSEEGPGEPQDLDLPFENTAAEAAPTLPPEEIKE